MEENTEQREEKKEGLFEKLKNLSIDMRYFATHTPKEGEQMFQDYVKALKRIQPVFENKTGIEFGDLKIKKRGLFTSWGEILRYANKKISQNSDSFLQSSTKGMATGLAGLIGFPLYFPSGIFADTFPLENTINVNISSAEFANNLLIKRLASGEIKGKLEENLARDLAEIYWKRKTQGGVDWKIGFSKFISTKLLKEDYSNKAWEVEKQELYPDGRVLRVQDIGRNEGFGGILNLPYTWQRREEEIPMKDYIKKNEPPQRKIKENQDLKRFLKVMIPVFGLGLTVMAGAWYFEHAQDKPDTTSTIVQEIPLQKRDK